MIRAIRCDQPSFRSVTFENGFNVVLADQTSASTNKDTRNGVGKSLLIDIIHFCLGSSLASTLKAEAIKGWTFTVDLVLRGKAIEVSRNITKNRVVALVGDFNDWTLRPSFNSETRQFEMSIENWTAQLGELAFDIPAGTQKQTYVPGFRNLSAYFIRRGRDAFSSPFENHKNTSEGEKQVYNAFLLGLNWDFARQFQMLKDRKNVLTTLRNAAKSGLMEGFFGSIGELQAEKVRLEDVAARTKASLDSFRVHEQYTEIEQQANALTGEIHALSNQNVADREILALYETSMRSEAEPPLSDVEAVYQEAGVVFPAAIRRRLDEVATFHRQLTDNRRQFLAAEVERLRQDIQTRNDTLKAKTNQRAEYLTILRTYGALEEYTHLQRQHLDILNSIKELDTRIQNLRSFESGMSNLKIEQENLLQAARRDLAEREPIWREAVRLFNANSEALYEAPGRLAIDVKETGYDFRVDIERANSEGIESMKIFCYDLMLAQLWAAKPISPRILVHDSTLYDGVDERQKAHALKLAAREAQQHDFQYICLLNSDSLPNAELMQDFDINAYVRITLTDQVNGCLLGLRY